MLRRIGQFLAWLGDCFAPSRSTYRKVLHRRSNSPLSDEEAWRQDAQAVARDWRAVGGDLERAILKNLPPNRVIVIRLRGHHHEVKEHEYDYTTRRQSGVLQCSIRFHGAPSSKLRIHSPRVVDCPGCIKARQQPTSEEER